MDPDHPRPIKCKQISAKLETMDIALDEIIVEKINIFS